MSDMPLRDVPHFMGENEQEPGGVLDVLGYDDSAVAILDPGEALHLAIAWWEGGKVQDRDTSCPTVVYEVTQPDPGCACLEDKGSDLGSRAQERDGSGRRC